MNPWRSDDVEDAWNTWLNDVVGLIPPLLILLRLEMLWN